MGFSVNTVHIRINSIAADSELDCFATVELKRQTNSYCNQILSTTTGNINRPQGIIKCDNKVIT